MQELVSIIIPVYNSAKTLKNCLSSVFCSEHKNIEVIIVDDHSSDSSVAIAGGFPCLVIEKDMNTGPAESRNIGASKSKGGILIFIDSDTEIFPDTVTKLLKDFQNNDIYAVVGIYAKEPLNRGFFPDFYSLLKYYNFKSQGKHRYAVFASQCAAIRRNIFVELGGFGKFRWGMDIENEEFGSRINKKYSILLDPDIEVKHYFGGFKKLFYIFNNRTFWWTKFFLSHREFDKALMTKSVAAANIAGPLFIFALILSVIWSPGFMLLSLIFLSIFLYGYWGFLLYALRDKGIIFALKSLFILMFFSLVISFASMRAVISYFFSKKEGVS